MKFVRYQSNGNVSYGTLSGDTINEIDGDPITGYSETGNAVALGMWNCLRRSRREKFWRLG